MSDKLSKIVSMVLVEKQLVFLSLGGVEQTPNGNVYLICQTDGGEVVLWLTPGHDARLDRLRAQVLPLRATVPCLRDHENAERYWVPENAPIAFGEPCPLAQ